MTGRPEVSVVIPTRDRWTLLRSHALRSALGQVDVELEVIVVDDGSTDGTPLRIATLGDTRVRLARHDSPRGPSAARNTGIESSRGEWIAFLDDDDLWSPEKLRRQLDAGASEGAGWVFAAAVVVDEQGRVLRAPQIAGATTVASELERGNVIWGGDSNVVVRSELMRSVGGFDESLLCFEDWDMWLRLAQAGRAASCPEVLVATVDHPGRMLFRAHIDVMEQLERMLSKHRAVARSDRLAALEWMAEEHARDGRRVGAARLYGEAAVRFRSVGNLASAVGALFGERGLDIVARVHVSLRGHTHLPRKAAPPMPDVPWLSTWEHAS